jgi:hypothetical protein
VGGSSWLCESALGLAPASVGKPYQREQGLNDMGDAHSASSVVACHCSGRSAARADGGTALPLPGDGRQLTLTGGAAAAETPNAALRRRASGMSRPGALAPAHTGDSSSASSGLARRRAVRRVNVTPPLFSLSLIA